MLKIQEIQELIKLIDKSSIDEFTYETDGATISMKKAEANSTVQEAVVKKPIQAVETVTQPADATVREESSVQAQPVKSTDDNAGGNADYDHEIVSPMVGTFYAAPTPESDPYVSKGSKVNDNTVVCIVEAMKLFNEIEAEVSGEIVEVLVEDGELVEYGQPLFRVKK